jgi:type IV secretory pathway TraG/TraD family ATPase VirD4
MADNAEVSAAAVNDPLRAAMEAESFFRLDRLPNVCPRHRLPVHGTARWATAIDLAQFLDPPADEEQPFAIQDASFLLQDEEGTAYTPLYKRPFYRSADNLTRNTLIVGQVGSGKTSAVILPSVVADLRNPNASVVALDVKGNLHQLLQPFVEQYRPGARKTIVLNFTDPSRTTHAWNPVGGEQLDIETALRDTENFFFAADTKPNYESPFWNSTAARWVTALLLCLRKVHGDVCLADVHEALEWPKSRLLTFLNDHPEIRFAAGFHSFLASDSHNALTALAQAQMHLRALAGPALAAITSRSEFTFERLFKQPTLLILEVPQCDVERLRPFVNLFFSQLFRAAAQCSERQAGWRLPRPLSVYLDDFAAAVGRVPDFGASLNLLRSRDVRITAAVQSLAQLPHYYGTEAEAILAGFATKIFKTPVDLSDAEWASRQSGTTTVAEVHDDLQPCPHCEGNHPVSRAMHPIGRPLILPDEIRLSPEHFLYGRAATVFLPDTPPFQCWFRPAHETPGLAEHVAAATRKPRAKRLRRKQLSWVHKTAEPRDTTAGFTDTQGMSDYQIRAKLEEVKKRIGWDNTTGIARKWWEAFENENEHRTHLVLRVAEELAKRQSFVTDFFLTYMYSNTENIQANLHYLDYRHLKKKEAEAKRTKAEGG